MKQISMAPYLAALWLGTLVLSCAHAADTATPDSTSKSSCKAEAGDRKGDERKQFMRACLSKSNG